MMNNEDIDDIEKFLDRLDKSEVEKFEDMLDYMEEQVDDKDGNMPRWLTIIEFARAHLHYKREIEPHVRKMVEARDKAVSGEWTASLQKGTKGHCFQSQIWHPETEESMVVIDSTEDENEANAITNFITTAASATVKLKGLIYEKD